MSNAAVSRRTEVEIAVEGTDITGSIRQYLKSMTYTDNEEDEADDLQIVLQDRDGIWMEEWLDDAIEAAASSGQAGDGAVYTVVKGDTLSGIARKYATTYQELAGYNGIQNPNLIFPGQKIRIPGESSGSGGEGREKNASAGLSIEANIVRRNWNIDGKDMLLPCGEFELDAVDCDGPPSEITLRATSLPFRSQIRQVRKNRGWENYHLSGIASEIAGKNGMTCMFLSGSDPFYPRAEQYQMSDIAFLKRLCHDAGISLKASGKMLILFDQPDYEAKPAVLTIRKENGRILPSGEQAHGAYSRDESCEAYMEYHLSVGTADTQYQSCRVSYTDPATGKCVEGVARKDSGKGGGNQQLEITAKVSGPAEAKKLAEKHLRLHNKFCRTAEFTLPGNPKLAAGVTVMLSGWGGWDGKYMVKQARHTVGGGGYTTAVSLRKVLEGY